MPTQPQKDRSGAAMAPAGWSRSLIRFGNVVLGPWLFTTAFLWPHALFSRNNTWIMGVIILVCALWALLQPVMRWLNVLAAIWLFYSTVVLVGGTGATVWHNVGVACLVFLCSVLPLDWLNALRGDDGRD